MLSSRHLPTKPGAGESPIATNGGHRAIEDFRDFFLRQAYKEAVAVMTDNSVCADAQEGINAFLEKRSPNWKGK